MKLVLGLEIHLHLKTATKMFCYCDANIYGADPNTHTCPVCLGLPGALPVPNADAVKKTQMLGLALGSKLNAKSRFDRKHYHYPDLPKGYQISQYLQPLCVGGAVKLSDGREVAIERIHLEEDTAKSVHKKDKTLIDFNKSGMPLVEIVTKPEFESVEDAVEFSKKIQETVRALGIADADMEKGQMRLEANISLREENSQTLPNYKVEIKNINSFRFMEKAVRAEMVRQEGIFAEGGVPVQENRGYDEDRNVTVAQREKEEAHDYRYFPEPDIPPMEFSSEYFEELKAEIPELLEETASRLSRDYKISEKVASELSRNAGLVELFEEITKDTQMDPAKVANMLINRPELRNSTAEEFIAMLKESENQIGEGSELENIVMEAVAENPDAVENIKKGKEEAVQFLVGQVMKKTRGKANPEAATKLLKKLIEVA